MKFKPGDYISWGGDLPRLVLAADEKSGTYKIMNLYRGRLTGTQTGETEIREAKDLEEWFNVDDRS